MAFAKKDRNISVSVYAMFALALFLAGFIFYMVASNQKYFEDKYSLYMFLPNVEGLIPGAFVTLSGLKVGVVGKMTFTEREGRQGIRVELKIDKTYAHRITPSSVATVKTMGILGDKYVDITLGRVDEPALQAEAYIHSDPGLDAHATFAEAAETISELKKVLANTAVLTEAATRGEGVAGRLFMDEASGRHFAALLDDLRKTTATIAAGNGNLGRLVQDTTLYANLERSSTYLHALLDRLHHGKGTVAQMINDSTFYPTVKNLALRTDSLLYRMQHGGTVAHLLDDPQFYHNLVRLTSSLDSLSRDMQKNPGRYVKLSLF